jgi:putative ABC transport system ATP-binding protein
MGPSGSGKSTLLNLIAGIDKPDSGVLRINGLDIAGMGESDLAHWRAQNVGFIFQFYNLMPVMTAYENVELPLLLTPLSRRERRERVELTLAMVNLADRMDHTPNELSGGQQQRVAIARHRHRSYADRGGRTDGRSGPRLGQRNRPCCSSSTSNWARPSSW